MIGLKCGNYLGKTERLCFAGPIIASITTYPDPGYSENLHYHETFHLSYILAGGNCEKRTRTDIERLPGVITCYDQGEPHRSTQTLSGSKHLNLEIEAPFLQNYGIDSRTIDSRFLRTVDAKFMMLKLTNELLAGDDLGEASIQQLILALLTTRRSNNPRRPLPPWLRTIEQLLHDKWDDRLTLGELAAAAGVHPVTVSKYFLRYFSCSIGEYRRKIRVDKAIALIETSSRSLTDIAHECGFSDQSHFIRTFRQQTGFSPLQYRKYVR
jgi:AraC family transcriptional regulator